MSFNTTMTPFVSILFIADKKCERPSYWSNLLCGETTPCNPERCNSYFTSPHQQLHLALCDLLKWLRVLGGSICLVLRVSAVNRIIKCIGLSVQDFCAWWFFKFFTMDGINTWKILTQCAKVFSQGVSALGNSKMNLSMESLVVVVVVDDSAETVEKMKLMKLWRLGDDGEVGYTLTALLKD